MAFNIAQIKATPPFTTLNSSFTTSLPKNKTNVIWASGDSAHFEESPTGSNRCVTYRLAKEPGTDRLSPVPILITGTAPVVGTWYIPPNQGPPATFKVQARLDGRDWILSSDNIHVTSPSMVNVAVQNMALLQPVFDIPMRIAGDWTWAIQRTDKTGFPPIYMASKTRLELCFVFGSLAPTGPWDPDGDVANHTTRPDFRDKYYIDLFRLFLPSQWELIDQAEKLKSQDDRLAWYLKRNMQVIWGLGLATSPAEEYPNRRPTPLNPGSTSESFYLVPVPSLSRGGTTQGDAGCFHPQFGGLFDLRRFMASSFAYCSALDLAALVQLCVCLVRDEEGNELLDSRWVASTGNRALGIKHWGFINPGTLFGWPAYPGCNSPVFSCGGLPEYTKADEYPSRVALDWHAWIEVKFPSRDAWTVLDASQAFGPPENLQLVDGQHDRQAFLVLKMDANWPSANRLPPRTPGRKNFDAICFYSSPKTQLYRIGVMGVAEVGPLLLGGVQ